MTALAARLPLRPRRWLRPWLPQAYPNYPLRDIKPIQLRPTTWTWFREFGNLLGGVVLVIAAVHIWRVIPW